MGMETVDIAARKGWMSLLAKAPAAQVAALAERVPDWPDFEWLRPPQVGGVAEPDHVDSEVPPEPAPEVTAGDHTLRRAG